MEIIMGFDFLFDFHFVNGVYHIYRFAYVELSLHPLDEPASS